jgi:hypothetical protein
MNVHLRREEEYCATAISLSAFKKWDVWWSWMSRTAWQHVAQRRTGKAFGPSRLSTTPVDFAV